MDDAEKVADGRKVLFRSNTIYRHLSMDGAEKVADGLKVPSGFPVFLFPASFSRNPRLH